MDDRQNMVLQIQQIGFLLVDLNLYLDTHPTDRTALAQYNMLHQQYSDLMKAYYAKFGPLMNFGLAPGGMDEFMWVHGPWPWQREANPVLAR